MLSPPRKKIFDHFDQQLAAETDPIKQRALVNHLTRMKTELQAQRDKLSEHRDARPYEKGRPLMATPNEHIDAGSRWLTAEHGGETNAKPYEMTAESNWDDAASAYREVKAEAERDERLEKARPDIEYHIARHGNLEDAIDFDLKAGRGLRNPEHRHATAVHLHRTFGGLPPAVLPEKPPPDEEPDGPLDEHGRDALERAAARAWRDVPREKEYQEKVKAAEAKVAELEAEHPNQPINVSLAQGAIAKQALEIQPATAFKLARWNGAPVDEQQAQEQHVTRQGRSVAVRPSGAGSAGRAVR